MLVVISNMLKRYSFQIPALYVQQLYLCCYLKGLLKIGLILSCRFYCFYYLSQLIQYIIIIIRTICFQFILLSSHVVRVCLIDDFWFQIIRLNEQNPNLI